MHRAGSWLGLVIAALLVCACDGTGGSAGDEPTDGGAGGGGEQNGAVVADPTSSPEALMEHVRTLLEPDPPDAPAYFDLVVWNGEKQMQWRQYVNNFSIPHAGYCQAVKEQFGKPPGISRNIRVSRFHTYTVTENDGERAVASCTYRDRELDYYLVRTDEGWRISGDTFENDELNGFDHSEFDTLTLSMPGFAQYVVWLEQRVRDGEFATFDDVVYEYRKVIRQYYDDTDGEPGVLGHPEATTAPDATPQTPPAEPAGPGG